ncbi:hypothetical protein FGO68_gene7180 [Halteria grandinella]|uniref:tRNA (adenine(58)-N(1))-methyltransferase n=1 Tax=Halteria grandinella TaxID=5974 RepID=A0A8J8T0F4_HALGN|nr:hypothetical protein FGO68_gene7180 [Halteria grandinella]
MEATTQSSIYTYKRDNLIKEGDLVFVYESADSIKQITMKRGAIYNNKFGQFPHNEIIDQAEFGQKVYSKQMKGWVYMLRPTSHVYTNSLAQRTQILYTPDISQVLFRLELKPGLRVVESGTGSGSLSTSIIRQILPQGHLFTYEFNAVRAEKAREDFEGKLGFKGLVTVTHRDVLSNGFLLKDEESDTILVSENSIDAVFLDLPRPQDAVEHAYKVLRKQGRLCNFSPCIEQVQKAVEQMAHVGFYEIRTFETLSRDYITSHLTFESINKKTEEEGDAEVKEAGAGAGAGAGGRRQQKQREKGMVAELPRADIRGHTGYLTFAIKF